MLKEMDKWQIEENESCTPHPWLYQFEIHINIVCMYYLPIDWAYNITLTYDFVSLVWVSDVISCIVITLKRNPRISFTLIQWFP